MAESRVRWAVEVTIQDLGSIGELVAAFATIATLGYLAVQIRHSTKAARRGALHDVVVCSQAIRSHYISNPDVAALYLRGLADPKQLSPEDAIRFDSLMLSQFENIREYYEVYQSGDFSKEEWAFCRGHLAELLAQPGGRQEFAKWAATCPALTLEMGFASDRKLEES